MKRNKIIVEESRINPKKMIVAKYRNRNKFKNREEIEGLKLKDERNYEVEKSKKSPESEEKKNKLEVTYKQKIEKKEVKKLENRQEINPDIEEVKVEEEVKEEVEIEEELNEEIYEVKEAKEIKEEADELKLEEEIKEEVEIEEELNEEIYEVQEEIEIEQEVEEIEVEEEIKEEVEEIEIEEELKEEIYEVQEEIEIEQEIEEIEVEEEIKEEVEKVEIAKELNEEIYEVQEEREINEEEIEIEEEIEEEVKEVEINNNIKLQEYIEENNIAEKERYETSCNLSLEYSGQIYKDRRIIFDPPKNDKIVSITNINRDIYVNDVEILENGVNVKATISVSINYGTSKDIFTQEEKCKENKEKNSIILESDIKEVILTDGVVRNTTVLIPCDIYINIPEVNCFDKLRVLRANLRTTNTQYILDNGDITNAIIPVGHSLKGMMERYILSIEVEVI